MISLTNAIKERGNVYRALISMCHEEKIKRLTWEAEQYKLQHKPVAGADVLVVGMAMRYALIDRIAPLSQYISNTVAGYILTRGEVATAKDRPALYYLCAAADKIARNKEDRIPTLAECPTAIRRDIEQMLPAVTTNNLPARVADVVVNPALGYGNLGADAMLIADRVVYGTKTSAAGHPLSEDDILKHVAYMLLYGNARGCCIVLNRQQAIVRWNSDILRYSDIDSRSLLLEAIDSL